MQKTFFILFFILACLSTFMYFNFVNSYKNKFYSFDTKKYISKNEKEDNKEIYIYIPDNSLTYIKKIKENILLGEKLKKNIIAIYNSLKNHSNAFLDSEILDVFVDKNNIYINFDKVFLGLTKDSYKELIIITAFVNSITELTGEKKIKFLIKGREKKKLGTTISGKDLFERDLTLVKGD